MQLSTKGWGNSNTVQFSVSIMASVAALVAQGLNGQASSAEVPASLQTSVQPTSVTRPALEPTPAQPPAPAQTLELPIGTAVPVAVAGELSTKTSKTGDRFDVVVVEDVQMAGTVVIPKGTTGHGEILYAADKGGFGKAGFLYFTLRDLVLGSRTVMLDGRFRQEGKNRNGSTAATYFTVGILAGFIKGDSGTIPKDLILKGKTGEAISFVRASIEAAPQTGAAAASPQPAAQSSSTAPVTPVTPAS